MTITFVPTSNYKEVKVEGYGTIKIRPYGAGEELQISQNFRLLDGLQQEAKDLLAEAKDKYGNDDAKLPDSFRIRFEKIQKETARLSSELDQLIKGTISSDEKGVAERLFNELPMSEIRRMITTAMNGETNAETN